MVRIRADGDVGVVVGDVVVAGGGGGVVNRIPCAKGQYSVGVSIHSCCCLNSHDDRGHVRDRRLDGGTKSAAPVVVVVEVADQRYEGPFPGTRVDRDPSTHLPNPNRDDVA